VGGLGFKAMPYLCLDNLGECVLRTGHLHSKLRQTRFFSGDLQTVCSANRQVHFLGSKQTARSWYFNQAAANSANIRGSRLLNYKNGSIFQATFFDLPISF
jgi:hypothetical protein